MTTDRLFEDAENDLDRVVQHVLGPLTAEQQRVIDVVANAYFRSDGEWPTYQFVEAAFDADRLDARSVIGSMPTVGGGGIRYGALNSITRIGSLRPEERVELTLLGLHHCSGPLRSLAEVLIRDTFRVLAMFVNARRTFRPAPTELTTSELTSEQVLAALSQRPGTGQPRAGQLYRLMENEPAFYVAGRSAVDAERSSWTWNVDRQMLAYDGVDDIESYVRRIAVEYAPRPRTANRVLTSPRSLPAALDYLDVVWRLVHGRDSHLVRLPSAERTMALGFAVGTREEFLERTSTVGDLLKNLAVPPGGDQKGGHPIARLGAYLGWRLPPESHDRIDTAIMMLDHLRIVRNAGGHAEAETEALAAFRAIGIVYPVLDWGAAWDAVRTYAVEALDALREELTVPTDEDDGNGPDAEP